MSPISCSIVIFCAKMLVISPEAFPERRRLNIKDPPLSLDDEASHMIGQGEEDAPFIVTNGQQKVGKSSHHCLCQTHITHILVRRPTPWARCMTSFSNLSIQV